jgi:guanylate kinase
MSTAERELETQPEFARVVVNDRLEQATGELEAIVRDALAGNCQRGANLKTPDERLNS